MKIEDRPLDELHPAEQGANPRLIDSEAVAVVARSITDYGFRVPLLITRTGEIICGHVRLLAARELGMAEVPCVVADGMTPEQVAQFRLVENRSSEVAGQWDAEALTAMLPDLNLEGWFDDFDLEPLPDPDEVEGLPEVAVAVDGEEQPVSVEEAAQPPPEGSEGRDEPLVRAAPHQPDQNAPATWENKIVFLAVRCWQSDYAEAKRKVEEALGRPVNEPGPPPQPAPSAASLR